MVGKSINVNVTLDASDPKIKNLIEKLIKKGRLDNFLSNLLILYNTGYLTKPLPSGKEEKDFNANDKVEDNKIKNNSEVLSILDQKTFIDTLNVLLDIRENTSDIIEFLNSNKLTQVSVVSQQSTKLLDNVVGLDSVVERKANTIKLERPEIKETVMSSEKKVFNANKFAKLKKKK